MKLLEVVRPSDLPRSRRAPFIPGDLDEVFHQHRGAGIVIQTFWTQRGLLYRVQDVNGDTYLTSAPFLDPLDKVPQR